MKVWLLSILLYACNSLPAQQASNADTIVILFKSDTIKTLTDSISAGFSIEQGMYLVKGKMNVKIGNKNSIYTNDFWSCIDDFPELKKIVYFDEADSILNYVILVVNCYNQFKLSNPKPKADASYFRSHGIYSRRELARGPTALELQSKKAITLNIDSDKLYLNWFDSDANNLAGVLLSIIIPTHDELFKCEFKYGDSKYYRAGYFGGNLKRAFNGEKKANRYIHRYRLVWAVRTTLTISGLALSAIALKHWLNDAPIMGINSGYVLAASLACTYSLRYGKIAYKRKNLLKAVNAYNNQVTRQ